jgi:hypothetical protein
MRKLVVIISLMAVMMGATAVFAQEVDPLLQLLIDKKVLTNQEAQQVQKEYDKKKTDADEKDKKALEDATKPLKSVSDALKGLKVGGTYYLSYQNGSSFASGQNDGLKSYNKFVLKRGYLDIRKEITPWLETRFTPDLTQDSTGDYKVRVKYLYADFHWKGNKTFSSPHMEVGMVHTPWIDFEEGFYPYRLQDSTFIERVGVQGASADLGVMFVTNFGPALPKSYQDDVSKNYPGKWGSFSLGVYNGGGYNKTENNTNKLVMARVAFRPFPGYLPGLQFHITNAMGKGNNNDDNRWTKDDPFKGYLVYPKYSLTLYAVTYQHQRFTLAAQWFNSRGNNAGSQYYTPSDYVSGEVSPSDIFQAYHEKGYSYFGDVKLGDAKKWILMARYDYYKPDTTGILDLQNNLDIQKRKIYGVGYKLYKDNMILLDYESFSHSKQYTNVLDGKTKMPNEERLQLTLQIKF